MRHKYKPSGGLKENPGVWDNGSGGLIFVDRCINCGVTRKRGKDYTKSRAHNTWGPRYFDAKGNLLAKAGECKPPVK